MKEGTFFPAGDVRVTHFASMTDKLIADVREHADITGSPEAKRVAAIAITNYEQAAMWAVKSLFS
jgi:hypothetical protein